MRRTPLKRDTPKSRAWAEKQIELHRDPVKQRAFLERGRQSSAKSLGEGKSGKPRRRPISEASPAQRAKVKGEECAFYRYDLGCAGAVQPAHVAARAKGGCDEAACVVPLCAVHHRRFDDGQLDVLPALVGRWVPELQHALGHYEGDLVALLQRLTGQRWKEAAC